MPKISVIVPVYKVEPYLDRCVESILGQTFEDFELILVDDGSPDRCGEMCDNWAARDPRIRVVHKKNGGLSDARNTGFTTSKAEWITFIDSDDYVHPKMLEALYAAIQNHSVQLSACGFTETDGSPLQDQLDLTSSIWMAEDFYIRQNGIATIACCKLYHRSIVLPYPVGKLHEDEYVTYRIIFGQGRVAFVNAPLYGYFQNSTGITCSPWNPKRMDALPAFEAQIDFFGRSGYPRLRRWRMRGIIVSVTKQMNELAASEAPDPNAIKTLKKWVKKILRLYWFDHYFRGESDLWLYEPFYPRLTQCYVYATAIRKKLFRRNTDT